MPERDPALTVNLPPAPVPPWRVVGASVLGASHEKRGTPCQDAHVWQHVDDWVVVAVCDGAGSATHSDLGAQLASRHAVTKTAETLQQMLRANTVPSDSNGWRKELLPIAEATLAHLGKHAETIGQPLRELACTLIVALIGPVTVTLQIGDGAVVARWVQEGLETLSHATGDDALELATFLTMSSGIASAQISFAARRAESVAVMSDGIQLLVLEYPTWKPFPNALEPIFNFWQRATDPVSAQLQLERFLQSPKVRDRSDDDITLLLVTRASASLQPGKQSEALVQPAGQGVPASPAMESPR